MPVISMSRNSKAGLKHLARRQSLQRSPCTEVNWLSYSWIFLIALHIKSIPRIGICSSTRALVNWWHSSASIGKKQNWLKIQITTVTNKCPFNQLQNLQELGAKRTCSPLQPMMNSCTWLNNGLKASGEPLPALKLVIFAHSTQRIPSECCCKSNVSKTLSRCWEFLDKASLNLFRTLVSSRKFPERNTQWLNSQLHIRACFSLKEIYKKRPSLSLWDSAGGYVFIDNNLPIHTFGRQCPDVIYKLFECRCHFIAKNALTSPAISLRFVPKF